MALFDHSPKNLSDMFNRCGSDLNNALFLLELKTLNHRITSEDASALRDIQYRSLKLLEVYESQEQEQGVLNEREPA